MQCAYCNNEMEGDLVRTKEHIIPNGLNKLFPDEDISFMKDRYFKDNNGLVIKDVCNVCNNGVLSNLDTYGNELIKKNFMCSFGIANNYNKEFSFEFNYHLLTRWLLKIAYNYDRIEKAEKRWFKNNVNYIIKGERDFKNNISLFAGIHINMLPVPEEVHGKLPLSIVKNPKLLPLGVTYSLYKRESHSDVLISSEQIENIYVMRFASAVFLLIFWKENFSKEKHLIEQEINRHFTFEKLVSEKTHYKIRRVSEAYNCIIGYGAVSGKQGLKFSEDLTKSSIHGRNFWEARAEFAKSFPPDFFENGKRLIEETMFSNNKKKK